MLNNVTCIIVDDELNAIQLVAAFLKDLYKNIEIIGTYTSWEQALDGLNSGMADIVFMDISMPGTNGINLLKQVNHTHCEIIFITAHEQYAIEAFNFSTSGYILKPIEESKFIEATDRALERIQLRKLVANSQDNILKNPKIGIPNNKGIDYINISEILYLETINKSTRIVASHTELVSSYYIGKFKTGLNGHMFYQVHRSYIINLNFILRYETVGSIIMTNKKEIPVSRSERERFLKLFAVITRTGKYL